MELPAWLVSFLAKHKSYAVAAGLLGLAVYQFSVGNGDCGVQSLLAAFGLSTLRHETAPLATAETPPPAAPKP